MHTKILVAYFIISD